MELSQARQGDAITTGSARGVLAAIIGNALEWFDLVVYGFFASVIAGLFFPAADPSVSLLLALATFGLSFLIRPVGAVIIGRFADRAGRRAALVLVSTLMLVGTLIIAILPTYAQIGIWAPILLLLARLIQGFSAGGEFGSATAYLAEQSPGRRAFFSSWQFASQGVATLLASGFGLLVTTALTSDQVSSWGWRLPFLFGLLIGPAAYFLRFHADETPEFAATMTNAGSRRARAGWPAAGRVAIGTGAMLVGTVSMYLMLYMPSYARSTLDLPASAGFVATLICGALLVVVPPIAALRADRRGRLAVMLPAVLVLALVPCPLFAWLVAAPTPARLAVTQLALGVLTAIYFGGLPALLSELFPIEQRTLGLSLCYNIAVVVGGGFAPMLFALLIRLSGSPAAPALYLNVAALISLAALVVARRKGWAW